MLLLPATSGPRRQGAGLHPDSGADHDHRRTGVGHRHRLVRGQACHRFPSGLLPALRHPRVVASIIWVYLYNGQISPIVKGLAAIGVNVDFFNKNIVLGSMANITTWTFTGYNMLIFLAALQAIPHDLYEAARIDGANVGRSPRRLSCRTCVARPCWPCCFPSSAPFSCSTNRRSCLRLIRVFPSRIHR